MSCVFVAANLEWREGLEFSGYRLFADRAGLRGGNIDVNPLARETLCELIAAHGCRHRIIFAVFKRRSSGVIGLLND